MANTKHITPAMTDSSLSHAALLPALISSISFVFLALPTGFRTNLGYKASLLPDT